MEVNVDEQEDIVADCDIKMMPTFVFIKNGEDGGKFPAALLCSSLFVQFTLEGNNLEKLRKNMETRK
ncbi:Thioredoxin [Aphelenchoides fujianensis]|nr:Thioredoxin [Aphelenchoides fujianensis]